MMAPRQMRAVGLALAVVLGLVGCGTDSDDKSADDKSSEETTAKAPARTVPAGYIDVRDAETGVALAIPQDWRQVPLNAETLRQQADALRDQYPRLAETIESARGLIGGGGKVFAIHPDGSSNVNLIVTDAHGAELDDLGDRAVREWRSRGATVEGPERTSLNGDDAVKVTMKLPVTASETVDEVQYYVVKKGRAYILTVTGHDPALVVIANSMAVS